MPAFIASRPGQGRTVVFLHGTFWDGAVFHPLLDLWRPARPCLLIDLPGQNRHPIPGCGPVTQHDATAAIAAALDAAALGPIDLVGHSQGALVGLLLAATRPDLVHSVVSISATILPEPQENVAGLHALNERVAVEGSGFLADFLIDLFVSPDVRADPCRAPEVDAWRSQLGSHPSAVSRALAGIIDRPDLRPMLVQVCQPLLIIDSAHDTRIGPDDRAALATLFPAASRLTLPCGHMGVVEQPGLFVDAIAGFIR